VQDTTYRRFATVRRLRGRSSGDGRTAKLPEYVGLPAS